MPGQDLVGLPGRFGIQGHELDEPHFQVVLAGELPQRHHVILREPSNGDRVEANLGKAGPFGGEDPCQDAVEPVAA